MLSNPVHALWMADIVAECATAIVVYRRRGHRSYPAFFALLVFMSANSLALAAMSAINKPTAHFYAYWIGMAVRAVLMGGVVCELFSTILRPLRSLRDYTLRNCMVVSGIVVVLAMVIPRRSGAQYKCDICALARGANENISWAFLIILVAMIVLSGLFGLFWERRVIGITLGLLVELWVGSITATAVALLGSGVVNQMNWVRLVAFLITNGIWIMSFARPESARFPVAESTQVSDRTSRSQTWGNIADAAND